MLVRRVTQPIEQCGRLARADQDADFLDAVVPIAEAVPLGFLRLGAASEVASSSAQRYRSGRNPRDEFPPLPAATISVCEGRF